MVEVDARRRLVRVDSIVVVAGHRAAGVMDGAVVVR